jgi:hypothetical protein
LPVETVYASRSKQAPALPGKAFGLFDGAKNLTDYGRLDIANL